MPLKWNASQQMAATDMDPTWARILELAKLRGWERDELIEAAGLKQPTVWKWEHSVQSLSRDSVAHIARILGLSVDQIEGRAEVPSAAIKRGGATTRDEQQLLALYRSDDPTPKKVLDAIVKAFKEGK